MRCFCSARSIPERVPASADAALVRVRAGMKNKNRSKKIQKFIQQQTQQQGRSLSDDEQAARAAKVRPLICHPMAESCR